MLSIRVFRNIALRLTRNRLIKPTLPLYFPCFWGRRAESPDCNCLYSVTVFCYNMLWHWWPMQVVVFMLVPCSSVVSIFSHLLSVAALLLWCYCRLQINILVCGVSYYHFKISLNGVWFYYEISCTGCNHISGFLRWTTTCMLTNLILSPPCIVSTITYTLTNLILSPPCIVSTITYMLTNLILSPPCIVSTITYTLTNLILSPPCIVSTITCMLTNLVHVSFIIFTSLSSYAFPRYYFAIIMEYKLFSLTHHGWASLWQFCGRSTDTSCHFWHQSLKFRHWFVVGSYTYGIGRWRDVYQKWQEVSVLRPPSDVTARHSTVMCWSKQFILFGDGELISRKHVGVWWSENPELKCTKLVSIHVIVDTMHGADSITNIGEQLSCFQPWSWNLAATNVQTISRWK